VLSPLALLCLAHTCCVMFKPAARANMPRASEMNQILSSQYFGRVAIETFQTDEWLCTLHREPPNSAKVKGSMILLQTVVKGDTEPTPRF
jgi:hypothetical protein